MTMNRVTNPTDGFFLDSQGVFLLANYTRSATSRLRRAEILPRLLIQWPRFERQHRKIEPGSPSCDRQ